MHLVRRALLVRTGTGLHRVADPRRLERSVHLEALLRFLRAWPARCIVLLRLLHRLPPLATLIAVRVLLVGATLTNFVTNRLICSPTRCTAFVEPALLAALRRPSATDPITIAIAGSAIAGSAFVHRPELGTGRGGSVTRA